MSEELLTMMCCPYCRGDLQWGEAGLVCITCQPGQQRLFWVKEGIPQFVEMENLAPQDKYIQKVYNLFSYCYDLLIPMLFALFGYSEKTLREEILGYFTLPPDARLLEVSIGTGANIRLLEKKFPNIDLHGIDLSSGMLNRCRKNLKKWGIHVKLSCANGSYLPYRDNQFDAVLHVGGINSFADKERALEEMLRVVKPGGKVVVNDEGLSPEKEKQWYGRLVIKTIFGIFASLERGETDPPIAAVPLTAQQIKLDYIGKEYFWLMHFHKALKEDEGKMATPEPGVAGASG